MRIYLKCAVALGTFAVAITEILGAAHALTRPALAIAWILAAICFWLYRAVTKGSGFRTPSFARLNLIDCSLMALIAAILGVILFIALKSPPNSTDAMAYHLPRVMFWAQQRSVAFFPTPYLNQIMLQPFAEYLMLQTYIISGGDHFINLGQWFGCLTSIVAVAAIAREFGAGVRGQLLAGLFCATIPNGILQASGAKNDYLLAAWLACAAYFLLRASQQEQNRSDAIFAGLALGLALGTKATAYLFAPGLIVAIAIPTWRWWRAHPASIALIAVCALTLNVPQYARNLDLSGSPLGFDSAQGDGKFRWQNEKFGWRATVSNLLRHSTEQLGARSDRWNQGLFDRVVSLHRTLGLDVNDPSTTWVWSHYEPPRNANHETNAPNRWHLAILAVCFLAMPWRAPRLFLYLCGLVAGFVLFCAYLKWQPYMARMFLPLFVLACPAVIIVRPKLLQLVLVVLLLDTAKPYLFENWVRPLKGPHSILRTSRDDQYFNDLHFWNIQARYQEEVAAAASSGCSVIGIDINDLQLEYPFEALLRERNPKVQFVHVNVTNQSKKYEKPDQPKPCRIVKLQATP
ncbi:MAG: glycosyltransferase family 39 protein [Bryobacteraceae bacterium]